jgi:hypothetical protein
MGYQEIVERVENIERILAERPVATEPAPASDRDALTELNELTVKVGNLQRRLESLESGTTRRYAGKQSKNEDPVLPAP